MLNFCIAVSIWIISVIIAVVLKTVKYKSGRIITPLYVLMTGAFFAAFTLYCDMYYSLGVLNGVTIGLANESGPVRLLSTIMFSAYRSIKLFGGDFNFNSLMDIAHSCKEGFSDEYMVFWALLTVEAPALTFGVVLTFFK